MDLYITGADLTLAQLFQAADGQLASIEMRPDMPSDPEAPPPPKGWKRRPSPSAEVYPDQVGKMALVLLANAAARIPGLPPEIADRLTAALNSKEALLLHQGHHDERSAMEELLEAAAIAPKDDKLRNRLLAPGCVSTALAAYLLRQGRLLTETADLCVAMNLEAIRGETAAFDNRLHQLGRPFPGQIDSAAAVRGFVEGSGFTTDEARLAFGYDTGPRCQDAICVRAAPQTHGGVRDALTFLEQTLERRLNPVPTGCNFALAHAVEHALTALIDLGNISERRSFRLLDSHLSYGLTDNLVWENPGFNHGMAVVQEAATALLGEIKLSALPAVATADSQQAVTEGVHYPAAKKGVEALPFLEKILAVEVLMAAQGMDLAKRALPDRAFGRGTAAAFARYRRTVAVTQRNRYLVEDLNATHRLVAEGALVQAAHAITAE